MGFSEVAVVGRLENGRKAGESSSSSLSEALGTASSELDSPWPRGAFRGALPFDLVLNRGNSGRRL